MSDRYAGRESKTTRNPHSALVPPSKIKTKDLSKLDFDDRIIEQWRSAFGCPVSDEAKTQFSLKNVLGKDYTLSDVRLWHTNHERKPAANGTDKGKVYLEFFFDGSPSEFEGQEDVFNKAFEMMIETQLQERRLVEFRQKLSARRRRPDAGGEEDSSEGGGGDEDWKKYLRTPVPSTELSIRSLREAGCMLRFLVCQTSISTGASEMLGQIAFQEHFPIDGIAQQPPKNDKPLPTWVYYLMAFTALMILFTLFAWWQVVKMVALAPVGSGVNTGAATATFSASAAASTGGVV